MLIYYMSMYWAAMLYFMKEFYFYTESYIAESLLYEEEYETEKKKSKESVFRDASDKWKYDSSGFYGVRGTDRFLKCGVLF